MVSEKVFCLDPSCFTSTKKLAGLHKILHELKIKGNGEFTIYVPTELYNIIILQPDQKFPLLKKLLHGWIGFAESRYWFLDMHNHSEYVHYIRKLFEEYKIIPAKEIIGNVEQLGEHSIHRADVIKTLGKKGEVIFEMMAVSSELAKARIISFGQKTISLIAKLGVPVIIAPSKFKKKIKERAEISWLLLISSYLITTHGATEFLNNYEIENLPLTIVEIGSLGLLLIADGSKDPSKNKRKKKSGSK